MTREGEASARQPLSHIAIAIVAMPNLCTATKAGHILQDVPMGCCIVVRLLDLQTARLGKGRQLALRYGFQYIAMWGSPLWWGGQGRPWAHEGTPSQDHSASQKHIPQQLAAIQTISHSTSLSFHVRSTLQRDLHPGGAVR